MLLAALLLINGCAAIRAKRAAPGKTCVASWYGPEFAGRKTASGQRYIMSGRTAASRSLPFGTILKITSPSNGRSTTVTVNDRGPFKRGRCLDLSYRAAADIGLIGRGSGPVSYEVLGRDPSYMKTVRYDPSSGPGPYFIQVGSFRELSNALRFKSALEADYSGVYLRKTNDREGKTVYRVGVGDFANRKAAGQTASKLAAEGYSVLVTK